MQSNRRLASATSRPRSRLLVRAKARETCQTDIDRVLLLVSELASAMAVAELGARSRRGRGTEADAAAVSACSSANRGSGCCSSWLMGPSRVGRQLSARQLFQ